MWNKNNGIQEIYCLQSCTEIRYFLPAESKTVNSNQAPSRHPKSPTYRCFLPDLAGFMGICRVRPNLQRHFSRPIPKGKYLVSEFNPAVADCRYRAPLTPHLARLEAHLAERVGFEPTRQVLHLPTRSPGERFRPLSHLSKSNQPHNLRKHYIND